MTNPRTGTAAAAVLSCAALVLTMLGAGAAGAAPTTPAADEKRPLWLGPSPAPARIDCAGAPTVTLAIGLVDTLAGDTTGSPALTAGYGCTAWNESGPEAVFRLEIAAPLRLSVQLASVADLDLFLLSACDGASCLAAGSALLSAELLPGEAWLVVDGYNGAAGAFELRLSCVEAGLPLAVCDPLAGVSAPVGCQGTFAGSVAGRPNLVEADDGCGTLQASTGGEVWFAVTVPPRFTVTATVSGTQFDAVLWVYGSCGHEAACLDWSDDGLVGARETVRYENRSLEERVVWVAVDAFRPVLDPLHAEFSLQLSCATNVPVDPTSLGGLKGLYR